MPSALISNLTTAVAAAQRQVLLDHALSSPKLTIGELVALGGDLGALAASLTVAELASGKAAASRGRGDLSSKPNGAGRKPSRGVDTRTDAGRAAYDATMLNAVREAKDEIGADKLRGKAGGTADQVRRSLHRLTDAKKVKRTGKARATKYRAR